MEDLKNTIDNGQTEVQIATIGDVVGTGADGSPVEQHLTEDSLKALAEKHKDDEILVDADHQSETGGKTEAKGWLSGMKFVPGKGLFGKIKWTNIGKSLIENRVFRWLSPSWYLNKDTKEPVEMTSVALTNKPSQAGRIEPIVNSAPVEMGEDKEDFEQETKEDILTMDKEELIKLIDEAVAAAIEKMKAGKEEVTDEVKEEVKEEVVEAVEEGKTPEETKEEVIEEVKEETADNACSENKADNGCGKEEDEVKNEEVKEDEEEKKEEVIKIEALNSAPKTFGLDIIKNSAAAPHYKGEGYAIVTKVS